jgi:hypothetical protein
MQVIENISKRPLVLGIIALLLGFAFGLFWGWNVQPVEWTDVPPAQMGVAFQEDFLRMTIDSFRVNQDPNLAVQRWQALGPNAAQLLEIIEADPRGLDPNVIAVFRQVIEQFAGPVIPGGEVTPAPGGSSSISTLVISVAGILILLVLVIGALIFLRRLLANRSSGEQTPVMHGAQITRQTEKTNFEDLGLAPPITQTMTTYVLGDDLYDESFSIDTQGGEFLGEYGVGVSETIGVGDPKKVTALEIWLFDKNDIKTATKVLMSSHAFSDMGIRGRLEPKGELVSVEPQKQIILETQTLQLLATVVDLEYGQGPMPPDSYFERLTLELAIWPKNG